MNRKVIDITKKDARVLIVTVYGQGELYEPMPEYAAHKVFDYAPSWALGFPKFMYKGYIQDGKEKIELGPIGFANKVAYYWTR